MAPMMMMEESLFSDLEFVPLDGVFAVVAKVMADPCPEKVGLGIGVYRDDDDKPWKLPVVRKVEKMLLEDPSFDHEYLPNPGYPPFIEAARDLIFGSNPALSKECIASAQTVAGTGANHIGARFLVDYLPVNKALGDRKRKVWLSDPTWPNHHLIWDMVGSPGDSTRTIERSLYPYYKADTRSFDFDGMIETLETQAERGDIILLHACAHNPTGLDPNREQWSAIANLCQRKGIFPFFDSAYQGFASGDLDNDAWAIREFASRGMEMVVAQSFSKNLGLYGQRVGALHLVCRSEDAAKKVKSHIVDLQRGEISTPPAFGARVAAEVLRSPELTNEWKRDLAVMSGRIKEMRHALYDELTRLQTPGTWEHIINQIGMFSYTGLTKEQVQAMIDDMHVYMMGTGRMSIPGLNSKNVKYVAKAIDAAVRKLAEKQSGAEPI
ncbi:hypothetical protein AJ80_06507 [Polytolypa hystricis UAMH7299]|uniref:Aspartate aminotransferase n=1 Tax=Polytolypa hystricis (strain UAMH7299) TaxID=1447883 RepID=A0A2B7XW55_POLH7|nr:hypothetical protein AJ80_06507 [Polytolypa hystricis UAMH7299]